MKILIVCVLLSATLNQALSFAKIPDHLIQCYRGNETIQWNPATFQVLVELIQKIENYYPTSMDLRMLSAKLIHDLRTDGIERAHGVQETEWVTPYSLNGIQTPKFNVLLNLISNVPGTIEYTKILTPTEICTLHKIISSSIDPHERLNELKTCPKESMFEKRRVGNWLTQLRDNKTLITVNTLLPSILSRCVIELGVVRTLGFGTISPGIFIASVASGLQPQNVKISEFVAAYSVKIPYENLETMEKRDTRKKLQKLFSSLNSVDNTYSVNLVSDLAETVLYQAPYLGRNVSVGFQGTWNDTDFPRIHVLHGNNRGHWEMTDSEILSGIDGLFISQQVSSWTSKIRRLRLSQLFEMYYNERGIPVTAIENKQTSRMNFKPQEKKLKEQEDQNSFNFDSSKNFRDIFEYSKSSDLVDVGLKFLNRFTTVEGINRACHRNQILEIIDIDKLKEETFNFAQILQFATSSLIISQNLMQTYTNLVVDRFVEYSRELLTTLPICKDILSVKRRIAVDLTVIIDGSRSEYDNLQIIAYIAELIDVSKLGSFISVMHGSSGEYIANRTNSVTDLFQQLRNNTRPNPVTLSLSRCFQSLMDQMSNQTEMEKRNMTYGALTNVVLVIAQSQRINQMDFDSAQRMLQGSLLQFPDLSFVFLSNAIDTFYQMVGVEDVGNGRMRAKLQFMDTDRYFFISSNSITSSSFEKQLVTAFEAIPKRIIAPFCKVQPDRRNWDMDLSRDDFEDYISPNQEIYFKVHQFYLKNTDAVRIMFQGVGYGDFMVCLARDPQSISRECKTVQDIEAQWFNVTYPCGGDADRVNCRSLHFFLTLENSNLKCSENDCRFPDQVRFLIKPEGLRCEHNISTKLSLNFILMFLTIISIIFKLV